MLVGGAAVTPNVCPQPTAGATVRLVCTLSSPLLGAELPHCGVVWPLSGLLAHCQACGAALMGSDVLARVDPQGAQGREGQAQLALPSVVCCGRGPVAPGGRPTRQRDGSTEAQRWVFAQCKQVPWQELVPFGILAGGWAREIEIFLKR